ncbi:MAG: hypothetical protein H8E66_13885 [Planctomycetes bacterium]|nr:hypothetical protein [Planctomycetota bacterium]
MKTKGGNDVVRLLFSIYMYSNGVHKIEPRQDHLKASTGMRMTMVLRLRQIKRQLAKRAPRRKHPKLLSRLTQQA